LAPKSKYFLRFTPASTTPRHKHKIDSLLRKILSLTKLILAVRRRRSAASIEIVGLKEEGKQSKNKKKKKKWKNEKNKTAPEKMMSNWRRRRRQT